jgi:hypothetical protein
MAMVKEVVGIVAVLASRHGVAQSVLLQAGFRKTQVIK